MKKRVFVVHWWWGLPSDEWFVRLKNTLEKNGFEVSLLEMPDTDAPKIDKRVNFLNDSIPYLDENTFFVWHSIWCQTIFRYLQSSSQVKKIWWIACVAWWFDLIPDSYDEVEVAQPWLNTFDWFDAVKKYTNNIFWIFSDDDYYVSLENEKIFREKLDAKTIIEHGKWHYDSNLDWVKTIPVLLNWFKDLS